MSAMRRTIERRSHWPGRKTSHALPVSAPFQSDKSKISCFFLQYFRKIGVIWRVLLCLCTPCLGSKDHGRSTYKTNTQAHLYDFSQTQELHKWSIYTPASFSPLALGVAAWVAVGRPPRQHVPQRSASVYISCFQRCSLLFACFGFETIDLSRRNW